MMVLLVKLQLMFLLKVLGVFSMSCHCALKITRSRDDTEHVHHFLIVTWQNALKTVILHNTCFTRFDQHRCGVPVPAGARC